MGAGGREPPRGVCWGPGPAAGMRGEDKGERMPVGMCTGVKSPGRGGGTEKCKGERKW